MTDKEYYKWQSKRMKKECSENVSVKEIEAYFQNPAPERDEMLLPLEKLAENIMDLAKAEGLSAEGLAQKTNLPVQLILQIENKKLAYVLVSDTVRIGMVLNMRFEINIVPR